KAGTEKEYFREEFLRRRESQTERLLVKKPDRSKDALLSELEELRDMCKGGLITAEDGGAVLAALDTQVWLRTIVERGKLLGYYVERKQIDGNLTVKPDPRYDWDKLPLEERVKTLKNLEAIKTEPRLLEG